MPQTVEMMLPFDQILQKSSFKVLQDMVLYSPYIHQQSLLQNENLLEVKTSKLQTTVQNAFLRDFIPIYQKDFNFLGKILFENIKNQFITFNLLYNPNQEIKVIPSVDNQNEVDIEVENQTFYIFDSIFKIKKLHKKFVLPFEFDLNKRYKFVFLTTTIFITHKMTYFQEQYENILKSLDEIGYEIFKGRFNMDNFRNLPEFADQNTQSVVDQIENLSNVFIPKQQIRYLQLSIVYDFVQFVLNYPNKTDEFYITSMQKYRDFFEKVYNYFKSTEILFSFVDFVIFTGLYNIQTKIINQYKNTFTDNETQEDTMNNYEEFIKNVKQVSLHYAENMQSQYGLQEFLLATDIQKAQKQIQIYEKHTFRNQMQSFFENIIQFENDPTSLFHQLQIFLKKIIELYRVQIQYVQKKITERKQGEITFYQSLRGALQIFQQFFKHFTSTSTLQEKVERYLNNSQELIPILQETITPEFNTFLNENLQHLTRLINVIQNEKDYSPEFLNQELNTQLELVAPHYKLPQLWAFDFYPQLEMPLQIELTVPFLIPEEEIIQDEQTGEIKGLIIPARIFKNVLVQLLFGKEKIYYIIPETEKELEQILQEIKFPNSKDIIIFTPRKISKVNLNNRLYKTNIIQNFAHDLTFFYETSVLDIFDISNNNVENKIQDDINAQIILTT